MKQKTLSLSVLFAIAAAACFGLSAPFSKILLETLSPLMISALVMIGSGIGLSGTVLILHLTGRKRSHHEVGIKRKDIPCLSGSIIFGSLIPTILLIISLEYTSAITAAILLSFEGVATTLIAVALFHEQVSKRVWLSLTTITLACILLSWKPGEEMGISLGALGVLLSCFCWGLSNNIIREISYVDPLSLMHVKGWVTAVILTGIIIFLHEPIPDFSQIVITMIFGFIAYGGLMGLFFIYAVRGLGSSRAGSLFSINPLFGVILSLLIFRTPPDMFFYPAFFLFILGIVLLITEYHSHIHHHEMIDHEHRHRHDDLHHAHSHCQSDPPIDSWGYHSHHHHHDRLEHEHPHHPDIHHRHSHES